MTDENKRANAEKVYTSLCNYLESHDWNFQKDPEELVAHFSVETKDLPIICIIKVDAKRQLIRFMSPLPFQMKEEKRVEGALAACAASFAMADGSFDYDLSEGMITFRVVYSIFRSEVSEELFAHMIALVYAMVDEYNDKFLALNEGVLSLEEFIES